MSVPPPAAQAAVRAAGGVVWRPAGEGVDILLVHRPKYDDWTFPKGKAEAGETDEETALREVEEETGVRARLGAELPTVRYRDHLGRPKTVRYWTMTVESQAPLADGDEVDATKWMAPDDARRALSYGRDLEVLDAFEEQRR